jgi:hypothetical protein
MPVDQMKHLLEIPCLDDRAFTPIGGRMRLYGKSDAPAAPDYVGLANQQASSNLQAARSQTAANRINQTTPYGSITYQNNPTLDSDSYNDAMSQYDAEWNNWMSHGQPPGLEPVRPDKQAYTRDAWSSDIQLSPSQQAQLDSINRRNTVLGYSGEDLANQAYGSMHQALDVCDIPGLIYGIGDGSTGDTWGKYSGLLMDRLNPDLNTQQAALDSKLANMGLTAGSEGWQTQQRQFGKQRNDANVAAQLAGADLAMRGAQLNNQTRQQGINERVDLRDLPLKELQALRSASGITNPTFYTPGQQGQTSGADLTGAGQSQYNAGVSAVNAQNQQAANTTGAGVGLLAAAASFY